MVLQLFQWLDSGVRQTTVSGRISRFVSAFCNFIGRESRSEFSVPRYQLKKFSTPSTISSWESQVELSSITSRCQRLTLHCQIHTSSCQAHGIRNKWNFRNYSRRRKRQLKTIDNSVPENVLVRSVVTILKKTDKWDPLLDELCDACNSKITPSVAVQVLKRIKKPAIAFKFFDWLEDLEGFEHDSLSYSAILAIITRDCNPLHASIADSLLHKKIHLGFDVAPADYDFVLCQWACVGRSDKGLFLLNEMTNRGFNPSITSCSILLEELLQSKEEELGWLLFHQVLNKKIDALGTETFNVVMKMLCKKGRMEEALELFSRMKVEDCVPDLDTFNILIKGCCEKGDAEMVFHLFKHMLEIKVKPDSYTVCLLIKELCKQGRPDYGNALFNHMRNVGWLDRKFVYAELVESLCNYGWWLKALKIFIKMVRRGHHPSSSHYSNLMRHLIMGSKLNEAFKLKDFILKKGFLPEIKVYNGLINGLCLIGRMEMVEELILELNDKQIKLNWGTYNAVLRGYCLSRNVTAVLAYIDKIKREGWEPDLESCNSLLTYLSTEGKVGEALELKNHIETRD
ncbi:hypothetical protein Cni_G07202 [Canna indica]|uniref:Pentatricopeptide repeat-containing protein n=1 Tax=Canna indica TaxID=4628 RepID=A0AAQ3Q4P6_9LILI|nr:hypothetical protein Cni_G07202 [Canna indica]